MTLTRSTRQVLNGRPRGDDGRIRGTPQHVLLWLTELQDAITAVSSAVAAPAGVDPVLTVDFTPTGAVVEAAWSDSKE